MLFFLIPRCLTDYLPPANALSACATVAEALVDVDSKFVKLADKECDSLSADVKKWFKVLAVCIQAVWNSGHTITQDNYRIIRFSSLP